MSKQVDLGSLLTQLGLHEASPGGGRSAPGSAARSQQARLTPMQFRSSRPRPLSFSPGSSVDGASASEPSEDEYDHAATERQLVDPLDRSEELDGDELRALLQTASALAGLERGKPAAQAAAAKAASTVAPVREDEEDTEARDAEDSDDARFDGSTDGGGEGDGDEALKLEIAQERVALTALMGKLSALQGQAAQLKLMSERSRQAQAEMRALMEAGDANIEELEAEKRALQAQLDQLQATDSEADQQSDSPSPSGSDEQDGEASPSPSDSELEVEVERQPAESDDELAGDTRQLAQLEQLMSQLASVADQQRQAARQQQRLTAEEAEQEEEEAEVDQRLFFGRDSQQQTRAKQPQPQPTHAQSPSSHSTILAVPASRVPSLPASRWIGPSTLPSAGGSGRHAVYADRPATAVGTTRGAMRGGRSQSSQQTAPTSVSWQAPTLSSLPASSGLGVKKTSLSSRSSLFVNAPESEVSSERSSVRYHAARPHATTRGIAEAEVEDSAQEDDADYLAQEFAAPLAAFRRHQQQARPSESPLPSDSDSELPYAINAQQQPASRPKSARQAAPSHLNGRSTAAATRQAARAQVEESEDGDEYEEIPDGPARAPASSSPLASSSGDLQSVLGLIGASLFRATINVGHTGGAMLGAGRIGAARSAPTNRQAWL